MKTVFLRVLKSYDKSAALLAAISQVTESSSNRRFEIDTNSFSAIPGSPFAYWVREPLKKLFSDLPPFETDGRIARKGLTTSDDARYVRTWWEPCSEAVGRRWSSYAKGGAVRFFHSDLVCIVRWDKPRRTIPGYIGRPGRESPTVECAELMGRPGLTWPLRAASFSPSVFPAESVFSARGYVIQAPRQELMWLLALTSSAAFDSLFKVCLGRTGHPEFIVGVLQRLPLPGPMLDDFHRAQLTRLARRAWSLQRTLDTCSETSHAFNLPALLQVAGDTSFDRSKFWMDRVRILEVEFAATRAEIDSLCFAVYDINEDDRRTITDGFSNGSIEVEESDERDEGNNIEEDADSENRTDAESLAAELIAWAVGVAFGRFDVRLATGTHPLPAEPEPFDPLPACSSAMLTNENGLPPVSAPTGYPIGFPENGILVDDPGHAHDLIAAVRVVFDEVFNASADAWWNEFGTILEPKGRELRTWLASSFFERHLKRYSKSSRKAPIIWQLSVPSGRYSVWLYAHRLTRDSFFQIQSDVVAPKLAHEERQLTSLIQSTGASPSAKERKQIAEQEAFVEELCVLLDEVKRVAPLWNPMLDDGVVLTMAPLWRLVPQYKLWQTELKSKWDELNAGKYAWSHLAMHLWPERVVPKCSTDRSLAIAHGLEDVFWVEGDHGKWKQRPTPTRPVDELVRERTSVALKAALKDLTEASAPTGQKTRKRRSSP
jgi:hypothetical protein